ncbi:MAG: hypothetical protein JNN17_15570 [Verrucomicrobiaceae bacterium]|nr:hypothetical protein [Verrucomicrobiaceae bacterium]
MNRFPLLPTLVLCVLNAASLLAQDDSAAAAALPEMEPIVMKPGALLEKDIVKEESAWARRMLLAPAIERWKGKAWAAEAEKLVEDAFTQREAEFADFDSLAPLAARFRELLKQSPDDPLLLILASHAEESDSKDWRKSRPLAEKALTLTGRNTPGVLESMAAEIRWGIAKREGTDTTSLQERWLAALSRSLTDGSYDESTHTVLLRHHVQAMQTNAFENPQSLERYSRAVNASSLPEWVKLTLRGIVEVDIAWLMRSSKWAHLVTDQQWQGFAEHLKLARDYLSKSNRLRPDRPEAASRMIAVAMGENVDLSELRAWFDRAVSAQFDYKPAYFAMMWACRPRWLGSHQHMLAFGKACAATGRYDTSVPYMLIVAALNITEEVYVAHEVFQHPGIKAEMSVMARGYLEAAATAPPITRHLRQSNAAMAAWLADDDALAKKALQAAGPRLHAATRDSLAACMLHESMIRAEVAADSGDYGPDVRAAANPAPETKPEAIHDAFVKINDSALSPDALAYVQEYRHLTGLQKALETGGWVDVPFYPHLLSYYQSEEGEWSVEDGMLVSHGTDFPRSRLMLRVPMEPDIEIKGEIAFEIPEGTERSQFGHAFGPIIHWLPDCAATSGVRAMLIPIKGESAATKAWCASMNKTTPTVDFRLSDWNTFSVRSAGGKLTYDINGRTMTTRYDMAKLGLEVESGLLGFTSYRMPVGSKVRVKNVAIRKITAADLTATTATPQPEGTPTTSEAVQGLLPQGWWKIAIILVMLIVGIFLPKWMSREQ